MCILNQKLVYGVMSTVGGTPGPKNLSGRKRRHCYYTASDIDEFVFSILTTLDYEGLEGLVLKKGNASIRGHKESSI